MDKITILSFRFHAKYGHFRKPYSNVSSLSYPFPPRTALAGLLGAVMGVPKAEVSTKFDEKNLKAAVEIEHPIKTITHVTNLRQDSAGRIDYSIKHPSKTKKQTQLKNIADWNKAAQIPQELLRYPSYIIYINLKNDMDELVSRIKERRFVYTPCMGLSGFLADLDYLSSNFCEPLDPGQYDVSTITDTAYCSLSLDWLNAAGEDKHVLEVKAPCQGTPERRFTYRSYLLNMFSKPLPLKMNDNVYNYKNKIISFL
jgi:CRISPR-associated protein Cas5h